jgi:hypothetical protein
MQQWQQQPRSNLRKSKRDFAGRYYGIERKLISIQAGWEHKKESHNEMENEQ